MAKKSTDETFSTSLDPDGPADTGATVAGTADTGDDVLGRIAYLEHIVTALLERLGLHHNEPFAELHGAVRGTDRPDQGRPTRGITTA